MSRTLDVNIIYQCMLLFSFIGFFFCFLFDFYLVACGDEEEILKWCLFFYSSIQYIYLYIYIHTWRNFIFIHIIKDVKLFYFFINNG